MAAVLALPFALAGALLLAGAGLGHVRRPHLLRSALRAQRALPPRLIGHTAAITGPAELTVAGCVLAAVLLRPGLAPAPLLAQAGLFASFAGYLWRVNRHRPGVPCGCLGTGEPVGRPAIARAAVLALGSAAAALPGPDPVPDVRVVCLLAGVLIAMAMWLASAFGGARHPGGPEPDATG